jgi:hypothetical protein
MSRWEGSYEAMPGMWPCLQGQWLGGIDTHWRARHRRAMPYEEAWPHIQAGIYWGHKGKLLDEWLAQYTKDVEEWPEQHRKAAAQARPESTDFAKGW